MTFLRPLKHPGANVLRALLVSTPLLLSACLFDLGEKGSESPSNPLLGLWVNTEIDTETVSDSIYRAEMSVFMYDRGYDFLNPDNFPPIAVMDSFVNAYTCFASHCDSVLWTQVHHLDFSNDSVTVRWLRNGQTTTEYRYAYRYNLDTVYQSGLEPIFEREVTFPYQIRANGDTLELGYPPGNLYVRSTNTQND